MKFKGNVTLAEVVCSKREKESGRKRKKWENMNDEQTKYTEQMPKLWNQIKQLFWIFGYFVYMYRVTLTYFFPPRAASNRPELPKSCHTPTNADNENLYNFRLANICKYSHINKSKRKVFLLFSLYTPSQFVSLVVLFMCTVCMYLYSPEERTKEKRWQTFSGDLRCERFKYPCDLIVKFRILFVLNMAHSIKHIHCHALHYFWTWEQRKAFAHTQRENG